MYGKKSLLAISFALGMGALLYTATAEDCRERSRERYRGRIGNCDVSRGRQDVPIPSSQVDITHHYLRAKCGNIEYYFESSKFGDTPKFVQITDLTDNTTTTQKKGAIAQEHLDLYARLNGEINRTKDK